MDNDIKVTVCKYPDRENLVLRYIDPTTGKQKTKSAKTADEVKAIGAAAVWEDELKSGRYVAPSKLTWAEFRKQYESEKLATMPDGTKVAYRTALDHVERITNPDRVCKLTASVLSRFLAKLREEGLADATVAKIARHVKATLRWAERQGLISKAPAIETKRQKGGKLMKGRPILGEEFDRMIAAIPKVRTGGDAPAWERLLRGLWLSGLRIGEAIALSWDEESPFYADLTGRHPRFRILGKAQKSGRDEVLPMTPDFAKFLQAIPKSKRAGPVFDLPNNTTGKSFTLTEVCRIVSEIGDIAGVIVDRAANKFASAHDLRRSFGTRWAKRVMPAVLKRLMRHADISTTMGFYVEMDADEMAGELWSKFGREEAAENVGQGNNSGNIDQNASNAAVTAGDLNNDAATTYKVGSAGFEPATKGL